MAGRDDLEEAITAWAEGVTLLAAALRLLLATDASGPVTAAARRHLAGVSTGPARFTV